MNATDSLAAALVEYAYLEGDFLLRSGKRSNSGRVSKRYLSR
jgi:orotate phosphoribosyltransferase